MLERANDKKTFWEQKFFDHVKWLVVPNSVYGNVMSSIYFDFYMH